MDLGYCLDEYLVHSFPEAKDEIYKAFPPFTVEEEHAAVWDEDSKHLVTFQEKEENQENYQVEK